MDLLASFDASSAYSSGFEQQQQRMPDNNDENYVPRMPSGKQKTPNMIRNQLQNHIDTTGCTQQSVIDALGVNNNTFRKFMNPKTYKNPMSAMNNGTYWAGGRFLDQQALIKKPNKTDTKKRKSSDGAAGPSSADKKTAKMQVELLMETIGVTGHGDTVAIYDTCPQVIAKIKKFLKRDGVTKASLCRSALGGINSNSLGTFLSNKGNHGCANVTYRRAYHFFERLRLHEGTSKTKARLDNECEHPEGFSIEPPRTHRWVVR